MHFCRVANAYVNQKKLDTETKILQANAAQFSKQTAQWLKLVEDFNTALKVTFHRHKHKTYYSNFDKHHHKVLHRSQYPEPTHLALDKFRHISSTNFLVVIKNAVGYSFLCKSLTRLSHGWDRLVSDLRKKL